MAACAKCGAEVADGTSCAACAAAGSSANAGLQDNVAGAIAYITIIPAILFLLIEPFNKNKFVRFHAFQCIFICIIWIGLGFLMGVLVVIPILGALLAVIGYPLLSLAGFVLWLFMIYKAYSGEKFKLPIIGDIAEKQANAV